MNMTHHPTRRRVLQGLGAGLALPWLESLTGFGASAIAEETTSVVAGAVAGGPPVRLAAMFVPNGVNVNHWDASGAGDDFSLSKTLSPLEAVKDDIVVIKGLWNRNANNGDGHYAKTANFLSGEVVKKTKGRDLRVGLSMDQLVAQQVGATTPLSSLVLATEPTRGGVDTNVGFTQIYGGHISWSSPTTPVPKEIYPRQAFDRLFGGDLLKQADASILDAVLGDARALRSEVSAADAQKLDAYYESIRDVERRIEAMQSTAQEQWSPNVEPDAERPAPGIPEDPTQHFELMLDLIVLAFQMNKTRVASFMFGNSVSGRGMSFLEGVSGGHHHTSHHENNPDKLRQYQLINEYFVKQYAYIVEKMKAIPEGEGSLLDNTMLLFGSGLSDGNGHNPHNLPIVVAGGGGGTIRTGRAIDSGDNNKLCALHLALVERMGVEVESIGDAQTPLALG